MQKFHRRHGKTGRYSEKQGLYIHPFKSSLHPIMNLFKWDFFFKGTNGKLADYKRVSRQEKVGADFVYGNELQALKSYRKIV